MLHVLYKCHHAPSFSLDFSRPEAKDLPCQQAVRARSYPHPPRANLVGVFGIAKNVRLAPEALDYMYYIFIYLYISIERDSPPK